MSEICEENRILILCFSIKEMFENSQKMNILHLLPKDYPEWIARELNSSCNISIKRSEVEELFKSKGFLVILHPDVEGRLFGGKEKTCFTS